MQASTITTSTPPLTTPTMPAQLSVIIPAYNLGPFIAEQLEALAAEECAFDWEVIVADNGSIDETVAVAKRYLGRLPGMRIVNASARRGAAFARNVGARHATGSRLVFIDGDDVIAPGFLSAIWAALAEHEFVAPRIEARSMNRHWGARLGEHPQYHGLMRYHSEPFLYHVSGCGMGLRRATFERLGGFDETMLRLQDSDLCFRAQRAGIAIAFVPGALIHGRNRSTFWGIMRQSYGWGVAEVELARRYRRRGGPLWALRLWARYIARWVKLALLIVSFRSMTDVNRWGQEVARNAGILRAVLRHRSAPL